MRRNVALCCRVLLLSGALALVAGCGGSGNSTSSGQQQQQQQQTVAQLPPSPDPSGQLQTFSTSKGVDFNSDFFKDFGTNERDCFTCHKPNNGWTVSAAGVESRFQSSGGTDEIFRPVDGSNCPDDDVSTSAARATAYSLLRTRGVIRISRPIPAGADFTLTTVDDPYNCVANHGLSLYRRPLPTTNLKFETTIMFDGRENHGTNLFQNLESQAQDATTSHAQSASGLTDAQKQNIVNFELALFTAQQVDSAAGDLSSDGGQGGPKALSALTFTSGENSFVSGGPFNQNVFTLYKAWEGLTGTDSVSLARESIARGERIFNTRLIDISGVAGLNDVTGQGAIAGSCSTCHSTPNIGDLSVHNPMNIGTVNLNRRTPDANGNVLPLYTFTCNAGGIFQVMDPGFALTTGKCLDIGKFKVPTLRGLAGRAPYFHDGQAATLLDVVDFYNTRFNIQFTAQEKTDLVNFLNAL